MEVHAHTHTARKKWTHYFWEFFMLFLAVSLGFMVENSREHYIEHKRAAVYAKSMVTNLQSDTAELKQIFIAESLRQVISIVFCNTLLQQIFTRFQPANFTGMVYSEGISVALNPTMPPFSK